MNILETRKTAVTFFDKCYGGVNETLRLDFRNFISGTQSFSSSTIFIIVSDKNHQCLFNGLISPRVFSYRCILPVGFNYGLKLQVLKTVASKLSMFTENPFSNLNMVSPLYLTRFLEMFRRH